MNINVSTANVKNNELTPREHRKYVMLINDVDRVSRCVMEMWRSSAGPLRVVYLKTSKAYKLKLWNHRHHAAIIIGFQFENDSAQLAKQVHFCTILKFGFVAVLSNDDEMDRRIWQSQWTRVQAVDRVADVDFGSTDHYKDAD